jgi:predicted dinucleotide-binding enzyme
MSYAIVGFGRIGHALARAFARRNMDDLPGPVQEGAVTDSRRSSNGFKKEQ